MFHASRGFKSRVWSFLFVLFFSLSFSAYPSARAQTASSGFCGPDSEPYVCGQVIVKFSRHASSAEIGAAWQALQARPLRYFEKLRLHLIEIPSPEVEAAIAKLKGLPGVLEATPNPKVEAEGAPNDPKFGELWGMRNVGQHNGVMGNDIDAIGVWDQGLTDCSSVLVAVLDTGIDLNHSDLKANLWTNPGEAAGNGVDDDQNGYVDDVHGYDFVNDDAVPADDKAHGTHVSGTIAAVGDNGVGVAGVCWKARLMAVKMLDAQGESNIFSTFEALSYAIDNGAQISNNSYGGTNPILWLFLGGKTLIEDSSMIFVAAAGNESIDTDLEAHYPSALDSANIVSVAALHPSDQLAAFSNYGAASVDLAAPGIYISSTVPGGGYSGPNWWGTSMASPHVAGAAALLRSNFPELSFTDVISILLQSARPKASLTGKVKTGGALDLAQAVSKAKATLNHVPTAEAGADQERLVGDLVELQGSGADPDGDFLTYAWSLEVPPGSAAQLGDPASDQPSFVADVAGNYKAQLVVSDEFSDSLADSVWVVVKSPPPPEDPEDPQDPEDPPPPPPPALWVVEAKIEYESGKQKILSGNYQVEVAQKVVLDAAKSSGFDPEKLVYDWQWSQKPAGSQAALVAGAARVHFVPDVAGLYRVRLTLEDGKVERTGTVAVTATEPPWAPPGPQGPGDEAPEPVDPRPDSPPPVAASVGGCGLSAAPASVSSWMAATLWVLAMGGFRRAKK